MNFSISLNDEFKESWVFAKPEYLHAWLTILFMAKRNKDDVLYGRSDLEIGEVSLSTSLWLQSLGKFWTRGKLARFFNNLESDGFIYLTKDRRQIKIIVLDYKFYTEL